MLQQQKQIGAKKAIWKSDFLGFTPNSLPILDFGVQHWNNAKIQPITKTRNFSKGFIALFVNFSSIFGYLSEFFWILGITVFILITSASNLVGCCRTQMWKCTATFRFFVFGPAGMIFYMWKMTKTPLENQQIYFSTFQKICTILV